MNVKKRLAWTALRTRESDVAPCTCSRDQTISTAAVIASFVCVRTQSDVTRIESPRWCVDTCAFPLVGSVARVFDAEGDTFCPLQAYTNSSTPATVPTCDLSFVPGLRDKLSRLGVMRSTHAETPSSLRGTCIGHFHASVSLGKFELEPKAPRVELHSSILCCVLNSFGPHERVEEHGVH